MANIIGFSFSAYIIPEPTDARAFAVRRSPGEGNGNPLQYSCLENSLEGGAWWATVHGVAKSQTQLRNFTSLTQVHKFHSTSDKHSICWWCLSHSHKTYAVLYETISAAEGKEVEKSTSLLTFQSLSLGGKPISRRLLADFSCKSLARAGLYDFFKSTRGNIE